jgi:hypothetical protein
MSSTSSLRAALLAVAALAVASCGEPVTSPEQNPSPSFANGYTGNGGPSGAHYNLNIIGVSKNKSASMDGNNGHRIFVKLYGRSDIYLIEGDDFAVLDANATDGRGEFQLPHPDPNYDGVTEYSIFARPLGKLDLNNPKWAEITTCGIDADQGDLEVCSEESAVFIRDKGPEKFVKVTKELTTLVLATALIEAIEDAEGANCRSARGAGAGFTRITIFDPCLEEYFWKYDNHGLKLLQLRFYPDLADNIS